MIEIIAAMSGLMTPENLGTSAMKTAQPVERLASPTEIIDSAKTGARSVMATSSYVGRNWMIDDWNAWD